MIELTPCTGNIKDCLNDFYLDFMQESREFED